MNILGISAFYHDSASALVSDGRIVAAAQEERFTRIKHDASFPRCAAEYCLDQAGIDVDSLDYVVFYEKPLRTFDRLLETYLAFAPRGFSSFSRAMPLWLTDKLHLKRKIRKGLGGYAGPLVFTEHHEAHAASAFFPSPFAESAVITADGVGEWATASIGRGSGNRLEILSEQHFPHSLGLLYSAFTYYCGFRVNSGEYKLMGLAPYGEPVYRDLILEHVMRLNEDGSVWMDMAYFNYCQGLTMTSSRFHRLFGGKPRHPSDPLEQRHLDLASSVQVVIEEAMLRMCRFARAQTGMNTLCLAGGVALNCVANGQLLRSGVFDDVFVQPAAGDAGGALGAALFVWHHLLAKTRANPAGDTQRGSLLGPAFGRAEIRALLDGEGMSYHHYSEETDLLDVVSQLLSEGNVVGWFQGRMEYGPRALGCRSILADARSAEMQSRLNRKIKYRESFRPFAPSVLREHVNDYFDLDRESPYMTFVADVCPQERRALSEAELQDSTGSDLAKRVAVARSSVPAITHVDCSARVQTVDEERHGRYYRLVKRFHEQTGVPLIVNTSLNIRGEPIVGTPDDACRCFLNTDMDALVLEDAVLLKKEQADLPEAVSQAYRDAFQPD
ncbi:MAG: carbamoyltransferase [Lentisphaerae bacterium]|jgi:carbamoyltransferase|nr:carbamoyltransferase [Lentisphaerota bacterium]MBT5613006.1 carbamoyltransferase [Lentisphaerota bacterium]MBT7056748.1 carbamoyltransferase [Lentisphaerota bacterium]MBT7843734.1 carbamoyltransferase [Lentisphaerota bacterium]